MSYQVLARKWRPRRFAELVGQEHVVRALTHALDSGRIHHAFLFTGTRGVGKTTIARIFAKSLNCERGVGSEPCGECGICRDVDAGRFLDLLEIDAASNTGVDDVREVIENAQYRPTRGGYKVYLIDEVHMLSKNAFNALLKTLEEPPEHAKFLLATTDPQKLPVTVLSRCLQFNLKRLSEEQIAGQVARILAAEGIAHDADAVAEIARGGNGSMRDALSLLDQAIAYGAGKLAGPEVRAMLGTVDRTRVAGLLESIAAGDAAALFARVAEVAEFAPDFGTVLDELAAQLHRVQLHQFLGGGAAADAALAEALAPEAVQLLYQIAITGRRDLGMAPNPRAGFEMSLLRMLAFRPDDGGGERAPRPAAGAATLARTPGAGASPAASPAAPTRAAMPSVAAQAPMPSPIPAAAPASPSPAAPARAIPSLPPGIFDDPPASPRGGAARPPTDLSSSGGNVTMLSTAREAARSAGPAAGGNATAVSAAAARMPAPAPLPVPSGPLDPERWAALLADAGLRGPLREFAHNVVPLSLDAGCLRVGLAPQFEHLRSDSLLRSLAEALAPALGAGLRVQVETLDAATGTLAERERRERAQRQAQAEASIAADPVVQALIQQFDARVVPQTTRPSQPE